MDHPEKATRKRKPKPNAQTSSPPSLPISPSLAAQPTVAPGAIPESGTGTELEALRRTQEEKAPVAIDADGVASKTLASRLGARNLGLDTSPVYDASIAPAAEGLTLSDPLNDVTHEFDTTTKALTEVAPADLRDETLEQGTLARIAAKFDPEVPAFQGIKMEEVPLASTGALDAQPGPARAARREREGLSQAESYALAQAQVVQADQAVVDAQDAKHAPRQFARGIHTTRLKMTLHSLTKLDGDADNPLTRCTFGAVYSANPSEEDGVFGKYTPYGSLSYNVRSDIAAHLEEGEAYYIDITKVPS